MTRFTPFRRAAGLVPAALGAMVGAGLLLSLSIPQGAALAEEAGQRVPDAVVKSSDAAGKLQTATFAGGCFWGVQGVFQHVKGVKQAVSGYAGGTKESANYATVSHGNTKHAEAVRVTYDPAVIRYDELLQIYFSVALDPTQVNRQGPDDGTQYRSAIFPADPEQAKVAQSYIEQLDAAKVYGKPIATKIEKGATFYPAEGYHQDFMALNPRDPYIAINDAPKLRDLKKLFPERANDEPTLVGKPKA